GDAALPVVEPADPGHDGRVAVQGEAVEGARRDRGHPGEAARDAALADVVETAAPRDDGAVAAQGEAVEEAGRDRGHPGEAARDAALPVGGDSAAPPGDHRAGPPPRQAVPAAARD